MRGRALSTRLGYLHTLKDNIVTTHLSSTDLKISRLLRSSLVFLNWKTVLWSEKLRASTPFWLWLPLVPGWRWYRRRPEPSPRRWNCFIVKFLMADGCGQIETNQDNLPTHGLLPHLTELEWVNWPLRVSDCRYKSRLRVVYFIYSTDGRGWHYWQKGRKRIVEQQVVFVIHPAEVGPTLHLCHIPAGQSCWPHFSWKMSFKMYIFVLSPIRVNG